MIKKLNIRLTVLLTVLTLGLAGYLFLPARPQAAESSYKFARAFSGIQARLLARLFETTSGHSHDGTDSRLVAGIIDGLVTTTKLATDSVTTVKLLGGGGLTTDGAELCHSANGFIECAAGHIDATALGTGSVTTDKHATDSITTVKLLGGGNLTTAGAAVCHSANGFLECADGYIVTAKLGSESVTTIKMHLDLEPLQVLCVTTHKKLGYCNVLNATTGLCTECVGPA